MDAVAREALASDQTIDITTIGRRSGAPRRIETWFHRVDGGYFLTGSPGRRDWYANLVANPDFTFHLKETARRDLAARATPIPDGPRRIELLTEITRRVGSADKLDAWLRDSPLVEVTFPEAASSGR